MASTDDVKASADKVVAAAAVVVGDLGRLKDEVAAINTKLQEALANGADPTVLAAIAAELDETSASLEKAHSEAAEVISTGGP